MGMPPGLPFFGPQMGAPQLGGSAQNNRYPAPGLQPYPTNKVGAIAEGLEKFMTSFFGTKEALKQHYDQKATDALLKIQAGLLTPNTADQKKILGWMQKADWPVRTEAPTPAEAQYNQQQQRFDQAQKAQMALLSAGAPTGPALPGQQPQAVGPGLQQAAAQTLSQVQPPQGPAPTPPNPTLLQRLGFNRPPVDTNSAMGQYLQQLTQAAQGGAPLNPANVAMKGKLSTIDDMLKGMNQGQQAQVLNMFRSALDENDPRHNDSIINLSKMGIGNVPYGEFLWAVRGAGGSESDAARMKLYGMMGGPQMLLKIQDIAKELLPRVGGDMNKATQAARDFLYQGFSPIPTGYSPQEAKDMADGVAKLIENKPTMPYNLAFAIQQGQSGNSPAFKSMLPSLLNLADQIPNKGTIEQNNANRDFMLRTNQFGLDKERTDATVTNMRDRLSLDMINAARESNIQEYKRWADLAADKNATNEQRVAAYQGITDVMQKGSLLKIPLPGGGTYQVTDPATFGGGLNWWSKRWLPGTMPIMQLPGAMSVPGQQAPQGPVPGMQFPNRSGMGLKGPAPTLDMPQYGFGWNPESNTILANPGSGYLPPGANQ